jgi:molybdate transport system regulatory protein
MSTYKLKIRIDVGKTTAMGPGKAELLELIRETGSISAAAKRMRMSYRRAWELVGVMNGCFDEPLVTTSAGGSHGGGAEVTEFGLSILHTYHQLVLKTNNLAAAEIQLITRHLRQDTA